MNPRIRLLALIVPAFAMGFAISWAFNCRRTSGVGELVQVCIERSKEVQDKCREADRRRALFEKKFPTVTDAALKSTEWERSTAWAQACDDAKTQLEEAILGGG